MARIVASMGYMSHSDNALQRVVWAAVPAALACLLWAARAGAQGPIVEALDDPQDVDAQVDFGYNHDDNVTRARVANDILADNIFSLWATKDWLFPVNANSRITLTGIAGGELFARYTGLSSIFGSAQASIDYRASGAFDAPTFSAFLRGGAANFDSNLRSGYSWTAGATLHQPLTDRLTLFGLVSYDRRHAQSAVFDARVYSGRLNLDYALRERGTLYLSGEVLHGDTVSSGRPSLENIDTSIVFARDDAFPAGFFSYRYEANTYISVLGYNQGLGPKSSIDIAWRRAVSRPTVSPPFDSTVPDSYVVNNFAISYQLRF